MVLVATSAYALWGVALAALHIRGLTKDWDQVGTLRSVREQRPHAVDAEPDLAHDEFAATVEDESELWIWRYRSLRAGEGPRTGEVLVPGRPQWTATVVESVAFDGRDAAAAAAQLVAVQQRAAALESDARARTRVLNDAAVRADELEFETGSTAAALRHVIGQPDR